MLDAVGAEGVVLVESGQTAETTREYQDGVRWDEGYLSAYFVTDGSGVARVLQPCVLVTDLAIERAEQLVPLLEVCVASGRRQLLIVAPELRDAAAGVLLANRAAGRARRRGRGQSACRVRPAARRDPRGPGRADGCAVSARGGRRPTRTRVRRGPWLGAAGVGAARCVRHSRRGWRPTGDSGAGARGAGRDSGQVRDNPAQRRLLEKRLANLSGVAALVRVGGATDAEREERRLRVEAAMRSGRLALQEGVVPGGGAALIGCAEALPRRTAAERVLQRALASPLRTIARLAGFDPSADRRAGALPPRSGLRRDAPDLEPALVDPYAVVAAAVEASVSAAATAISADAVVRRST